MDQKRRFEEAMIKKELTQANLLRRILQKVEPESLDNYRSKTGNFSKMIAGDRYFPQNYIVAIEEILETTISYLVTGKGEKPIDEFHNKGIRFTAYKDEMYLYEILKNESHENYIIGNIDEYSKTILDYILEWKRYNGVKFLIENSLLHVRYDGQGVSGSFDNSIKYLSQVIEIICKNDDFQLFESFLGDQFKNEISVSGYNSVFDNQNLLKAILESSRLLEGLLESKEISLKNINEGLISDDEIIYYYNPILLKLIFYALENHMNYKKQAMILLDFAIKHNDYYLTQSKYSFFGFKINDKGFVKAGGTIYGNVFKLESKIDKYDFNDDFKKKFNIIDNQLAEFERKAQTEGLIYIKQHSDNIFEYDFYDIVNNFSDLKIPKYLGIDENNNDKFELIDLGYNVRNNFTSNEIASVLNAIIKIQNVTKKILNGNEVYVHGNITPENTTFFKGELVYLNGWEKVRLGKDYEDILSTLIQFLEIDNLHRNNKKVLEIFIEVIPKLLSGKAVVKNAINNVDEYFDYMFQKLNKNSATYEYDYQGLWWSKSWFDIYKEQIMQSFEGVEI